MPSINIENAQENALEIVRDIEDVSIGISWAKEEQLWSLRIKSNQPLSEEITKKLRALDVPIFVTVTNKTVRLDHT